MKRAVRRHHVARLKRTRRFYYNHRDKNWNPVELTGRALGYAVKHPAVCSCTMCGNPRRYFGWETRKEERNRLSFIEQCEESGVRTRETRPRKSKTW